jgi:uncharacterized protein YlaI
LTVLLLFAQCKMHYWWLVTWLDLIAQQSGLCRKECFFAKWNFWRIVNKNSRCSSGTFNFHAQIVKSSGLRKPVKWHLCKEGQHRKQKDQTAARLGFLNYLAFLRPAADRTDSALLWVVCRGRL